MFFPASSLRAGLICCADFQFSARIPLPTPFGGHLPPGGRDFFRRRKAAVFPMPTASAGDREGRPYAVISRPFDMHKMCRILYLVFIK